MRQQTVSTSLLSVKKNTNTIKWLFSIKMFQQQKKIRHSTVEIILKSIKETLYPKTCKSFQRTPLCVRIFPFAQLCKMDHVETIICISDT